MKITRELRLEIINNLESIYWDFLSHENETEAYKAALEATEIATREVVDTDNLGYFGRIAYQDIK